MKIEKKEFVVTTKTVTIEFTEEEFTLFRSGLGNLPMSNLPSKQFTFFNKLWDELPSTPLY